MREGSEADFGGILLVNKTLTYFLLVAVLTGPVGVVFWFVLPWIEKEKTK
jgi:hypothetical protein